MRKLKRTYELDGHQVERYIDVDNVYPDFLVCSCEQWHEQCKHGKLRPQCRHTKRFRYRSLVEFSAKLVKHP